MDNKAIFWISSGKGYVEEASLSAWSVGKQEPSIPRILFTPDTGVVTDAFTEVRQLPGRIHPGDWWLESIRYLGLALESLPKYLVWATSDIYCCTPFVEYMRELRTHEWASTITPGGKTGPTYALVPDQFQELSICAVGLHNTPPLREFVAEWYALHQEHAGLYCTDQNSLREMLWKWRNRKDFRLHIFPNEWLVVLAVNNHLTGKAAFLHGRPENIHTFHNAAVMQRYARSVNSKEGERDWRPGHD